MANTNKVSEDSKIVFASSYSRMNGQPIDDTLVWYPAYVNTADANWKVVESTDTGAVLKTGLERAQHYATTATAYVGQVITVMTNIGTEANPSYSSKVYVINDAAGTLKETGGGYVIAGQKADTTLGKKVTAEGDDTTASGNYSHAEGTNTIANGIASHAEGSGTKASDNCCHSEGYNTTASCHSAHAEGYYTYVNGVNNCATGAHAEGYYTEARGKGSHAEGGFTTAIGRFSHAEGGDENKNAEDYVSAYVTENGGTFISVDTTDEATLLAAWEDYPFSLAYGACSHIEGAECFAVAARSHAEGYGTIAIGIDQHVQGHYNRKSTTDGAYGNDWYRGGTKGDAFIIGNGSSHIQQSPSFSNAFRVTFAGATYGLSAFNTSGADYAEYFEWLDANTTNEDRRGYFVTMDGEKIKFAGPNDYILGIVSGMPAIIGNGDEDWRGRYVMDDFGAFITEKFEYEETIIDEETGKEKPIVITGTKYKENPDYDPTKPYMQRADRPEWDAVGMMGVLSVRDDGTCQVNGYCTVAKGGIATAAESGYRVIKRVNDHIVKVIFR